MPSKLETQLEFRLSKLKKRRQDRKIYLFLFIITLIYDKTIDLSKKKVTIENDKFFCNKTLGNIAS